MAQCIKCNANIPDGTEICDNCSSLEQNKADESYLDSLLNSITPSEDTKDINLRKKQQNNEQHDTEIQDKRSWNIKTEDSLVKPIPKDYNIFSTSDNDEELDFLNSLFGNVEESEADEQMNLDPPEDIVPEIAVAAEEEQDNSFNDLYADFLSMSDPIDEDIKILPEEEQVSMNYEEEEPATMKDAYDFSDNDQDILDLINEINNSEELTQDDKPEVPLVVKEVKKSEDSVPADIADIYADALSAVTSLDDMQIDQDLMDIIPTKNESSKEEKETSLDNSKKSTKLKTKQNKTDKNKVSLWKRIFGNIKEDISEEELEARKQKVIEEGEKEEQEKLKKAEELKAEKNRSKAEKAENARKAKEEAARKKAEKAAIAKAKKEEKEKRSKEIQELIDEIDENEGKINKVGASIVFVFFAATAIVIVIGTNLYSYAVNITNANESFNRRLYNDAYENVYGIEVKDEDLELYDKIMTVMYVNKQLNSYNNFLNMNKYPEALDSLLKGLDRYEKYFMLASMHGIESDLNYVKDHIIEELNKTFLMSEDEAKVLLTYDDQNNYSMAVYELANEHVEDTSEETNEGEQSETDNGSEQDTSTESGKTDGN